MSQGAKRHSHVPSHDTPKVLAIWKTLPAQLAKENKRFLFSFVREGARARSYEDALSWLDGAGLVLKAYNASVPRVPLSSYASSSIFKVYLLDVGLLGALSEIDPKIVLSGSLTENYVAQQLIASGQENLYYWTSSGEAEVDFLVQTASGVVPLEVKAAVNLRSKSLQSYAKKHEGAPLYRTSLRNFDKSGAIRNIPLYAIGNLTRYLDL